VLGIHKIKTTVKKIANGRFHSVITVFRISVKDAVLITSRRIRKIAMQIITAKTLRPRIRAGRAVPKRAELIYCNF
jgi:hypothetical protein